MAKLLLDENMPRSTGPALLALGHEAIHVSEISPGAPDRDVLQLARSLGRILATRDSDFGDLVFQQGEPAPDGIVYLREHLLSGALAAEMLADALRTSVEGWFVVCTADGQRRRRLPLFTPP